MYAQSNEGASASCKNYVRDKNFRFSLGNVRRLAYQWMTSLNAVINVDYKKETRKI